MRLSVIQLHLLKVYLSICVLFIQVCWGNHENDLTSSDKFNTFKEKFHLAKKIFQLKSSLDVLLNIKYVYNIFKNHFITNSSKFFFFFSLSLVEHFMLINKTKLTHIFFI